MSKSYLFIFIYFISINIYSQVDQNFEYQYSINDTINGQIETANRLKLYIDNNQFDDAINLFSKEQQLNISKFRNDETKFSMWCNAWTISEYDLSRYISRIKRRKGQFVFENGIWKIDER